MAKSARDSVSTAVSTANADGIASNIERTDTRASQKLPRFFTQQVLIGFLNDIFSSCTFTKKPEVPGEVLDLGKGTPSSDRQYMLVLRFEKQGILYEILSHDFASAIKGKGASKAEEASLRAETLSSSLVLALLSNIQDIDVYNRIPTSILKTYISKPLYRGGLWAYMSLPCLLSRASAEDATATERRGRMQLAAENGLHPISGVTILALLRALHYMKADHFLLPVCVALCKEYMATRNDASELAHVIHYGSMSGALSQEFITQYVNGHFNNVSVLGTMSGEDLVLLLGSFEDGSSLSMLSLRKALLVLADEVEMLSAECTLCLLWVLVKLRYDFEANSQFTRQLLYRLALVIDDLPLSSLVLVCTLAFVRCDFPHFNQVLDSVLLKFHLIEQTTLILIGAAYAFSRHLLSHSDAVGLGEPRSGHVHDCLEYYVKEHLWQVLVEYDGLSSFLCDSLALSLKNSEPIKSVDSTFPRSRAPTQRSSHKSITPTQSGSSFSQDIKNSQSFSGLTASANSSKLYYLNLVEDCCLRYDDLDFDSLCLLLFSLLVSHIDVSPLYNAMLVSQGLMLRKAHNPVQIQETRDSDVSRQYEMCYAILHHAQHPEEIESPLQFGSIRSHCSSVGEDTEEVEATAISPSATAAPPVVLEGPEVDSVAPALSELITSSEDADSHSTPERADSVPPAAVPPSGIQMDQDVLLALAALTAALKVKDRPVTMTAKDVLRICKTVLESGKICRQTQAFGSENDPEEILAQSAQKETKEVSNERSAPRSVWRDKRVWRTGAYPVNEVKKSTSHSSSSDIDGPYQVMYMIRPVCRHRATLVKHRVSIRYTYVKVHRRRR
ncbi:uncharacterized protein BXIN_0741 [Babesia sp. Xinjiang]|uniref:uncharacterized protein n=1 Tax=Babesia sp. Xinjiang TaxID=462227 RepID=UPI000A22D26C|nr:uncharacterized protein BXIN_0741 [Babesia sp. Xinjiang]ORM41371.1 hypothetical protein BXIN_0741 [Babesia sp. Xinjiang]